jgi:hypothetical protein
MADYLWIILAEVHFVDPKMYFRDCKTLSVFERKIPLTLEFRFHQEWRPCIMPGFFPPISPSCGTVALYGPFGFFLRYGGLSMNNLGWSL